MLASLNAAMLVPEGDRRYPMIQPGRCNIIRSKTMPVMAGGFDISRANPFRRAGEFGYLSKRLQMRDSGLFGRPFERPSSGHLAGRPRRDRRRRVE